MHAYRCVGANAQQRMFREQGCIKCIAHAVQALKFVPLDTAGALDDAGDGERIMGGELRINVIAQREQTVGAGEITEIGHRLAGEHRIIGQAAFLRTFDFRVPVSAFHEPHHETAVERGGQFAPTQSITSCARFPYACTARAEAVPPGKLLVLRHRADHVERQFQAVGFFGVDGEIQATRMQAARAKARTLGTSSASSPVPTLKQPRSADAKPESFTLIPGPVRQRLVAGSLADGVDGGGVTRLVARRIVGGARAFAEHVETVAGTPGRRARWRGRGLRRWSVRARNDCPSHASPGASRCARWAGRGGGRPGA